MAKKASLLCEALRVAREGGAVFPLNGKMPRKGSHGFKDGTTNAEQITAWWTRTPTANIGLATGRMSRVVVIDEDEAGALARAQEQYGPLPPTRTVLTARGQHLHFAYPEDGLKVPSRGQGHSAGQFFPGIDVKADGGLVVLPPSLHPDTGKPYRWRNQRAPLAPLPGAWLAAIRAKRNGDGSRAGFTLPPEIPRKTRNTTLFGYGCALRARGVPPDTILQELHAKNRELGRPPDTDVEVERVFKSVLRYEPTNHTDLGNARRLVVHHGEDLRYVHAWKCWLVWDGRRWRKDEAGEAEQRAKATVDAMYAEAAVLTDNEAKKKLVKWALTSSSAQRIEAMLRLARSEPDVALRSGACDTDPWLLNIENGTLDLRSGTLREARREDLITRLAPVVYDPKATAPRWMQFLNEIAGDDKDLPAYLQRISGYAFTGDASEQAFFVCYGEGKNGKSTFLEVIRGLLGDYASNADFSTFLSDHGRGVRNDIARLNGARFISAVEADEGARFHETILKYFTGTDTITARFLYQEAIEFRPQGKLFFAANHKPSVRETGEAFWRRVRMVVFPISIPVKQRDKRLLDTLKAERSGILNWALAGCRVWQVNGLADPDSVRKATAAYRQDQDLFGQFLKDCCVPNPQGSVEAPELRQEYEKWCRDEAGIKPCSGNEFHRQMTKRGYRFQRGHRERRWFGLELPL